MQLLRTLSTIIFAVVLAACDQAPGLKGDPGLQGPPGPDRATRWTARTTGLVCVDPSGPVELLRDGLRRAMQ